MHKKCFQKIYNKYFLFFFMSICGGIQNLMPLIIDEQDSIRRYYSFIKLGKRNIML